MEWITPPLIIWGAVIAFFILKAILGAAGKGLDAMDRAIDRRAERKTIARLIAREATYPAGKWALPAPESYAILKGIHEAGDQAFKLAILQLLAARVLNLDIVVGDQSARFPGGAEETVLKRGTADSGSLKGSLAAAYRVWEETPEPKTLRAVARTARAQYGSLGAFYELAVRPGLVSAGSASSRDYTMAKPSSYSDFERRLPSQSLTYALAQSGIAAAANDGGSGYSVFEITDRGMRQKEELESRLAPVLRRINQDRPEWIADRPEQALMAAVVAISAGIAGSVAENDAQLIGPEIDEDVAPQPVPVQGVYDDYPIFIDSPAFDNLERISYAMVNLENGHDQGGSWADMDGNQSGDAGGDGGDSGGGDGGGDSGGGDFGGGGGGD